MVKMKIRQSSLKLTLITLLFCMSVIPSRSQLVSLSTTKTMLLYQWIKNPLIIIIENTLCKDIVVKVSAGKIYGNNCSFTYKTEDTAVSKIVISIGVRSKNKIKWIKDEDLYVKPYPTPEARIGISGNRKSIMIAELLAQPKVWIADYPFGFEAVESPKLYRVNDFSISIKRSDSLIYKFDHVNGNMLPLETQNFIRNNSHENDILEITNMEFILFDKERRKSDQVLDVKILWPPN